MTCDHCVQGLRPLEWTDAQPGDPLEVAVCLCADGQVYRQTFKAGDGRVPLWRVWCAVHQVDPSRVCLLEDIYSADELAAVGFAPEVPLSREAALLCAAARQTW